MQKSKLLMTEQPIVVNRDLAKIVGLNEAIILQQIEYWININEKAQKESAFNDGFYWTYNTVQEWQEQFPFWSNDTVKRTLNKLRKKEILITGRFNKKGFDRTLWYRINYSLLDSLSDTKNSISAKCTNEETSHLQDQKNCKPLKKLNSAKCTNAIGQNAPMQQGKMHQAIPKIKTETKTETILSSSSKKIDEEDIKQILQVCQQCNYKLKKSSAKNLLVTYDITKIIRAIITASTTKTNIKNYDGYLVSVLNDMEKTKINNISVAQKDNKSNGNFNNFEQRDYDFDDLEKKLLGWSEEYNDKKINI